ncbi:MAG: L-ribulose-5-phosphate 3-epimerase [Spirochaetales bacterium]|nr:L-ribulose-5-phosphate 3-epimerase [Spirochaetales bacterium]
MTQPRLGIYEKALPEGMSWPARLAAARNLGFDFVEMSIDESDARLARLAWSTAQRREFRDAVLDAGLPVPSICLSGHRRFPLGSADASVRERGRDILERAIQLAVDIGVRTVQLAGYDVYYEPSTPATRARFLEAMEWAAGLASGAQVMLAMEIMDYPLMNSISRWHALLGHIRTPWFCVYPDLGNLSAWWNDVPAELASYLDRITAIHLKDTLPVGPDFPGKFRDVPFGTGCVDFVGAFRVLAELGYRGSFLIEMWSSTSADPLGEVAKARDWMLARMMEGGIAHA